MITVKAQESVADCVPADTAYAAAFRCGADIRYYCQEQVIHIWIEAGPWA